jgi:hypothetical protein
MDELQRRLLRSGQFIPGIAHHDTTDLAATAQITATSELALAELSLRRVTPAHRLLGDDASRHSGARCPTITFTLDVASPTTLRAELRISGKPGNHTPDIVLETLEVPS